jgi:hypothetical protein
MEMPKPSIEHNRLQCLVGAWEGAEKIHPSSMVPIGGKAIGRVINRFGVDGFAIFHDYEQERNGKPDFHGHGVIIWNNREQCYIMFWFHSTPLPPTFLKGTLINDIMVLQSEDTLTKVRITWDFQRGDRYLSRIETSPDGEEWSPFVEATYYRKDTPETKDEP